MHVGPFDHLPADAHALVDGHLKEIDRIREKYKEPQGPLTSDASLPLTAEEAERRVQAFHDETAVLREAIEDILKQHPRPLIVSADQEAELE